MAIISGEILGAGDVGGGVVVPGGGEVVVTTVLPGVVDELRPPEPPPQDATKIKSETDAQLQSVVNWWLLFIASRLRDFSYFER